MDVQNLNDLKNIDPKVLEKDKIQVLNADSFAKLGKSIISSPAASNVKQESEPSCVKQGNNALTGPVDKSKNTSDDIPEEAENNRKKNNATVKRYARPRPRWPFGWSYPPSHGRRRSFSAEDKQEEQYRDIPESTDITRVSQEQNLTCEDKQKEQYRDIPEGTDLTKVSQEQNLTCEDKQKEQYKDIPEGTDSTKVSQERILTWRAFPPTDRTDSTKVYTRTDSSRD